MPNREIIGAYDEGYEAGQQDLRKDLCPSCAAKGVRSPHTPSRPANTVSMIEFVQRRGTRSVRRGASR